MTWCSLTAPARAAAEDRTHYPAHDRRADAARGARRCLLEEALAMAAAWAGAAEHEIAPPPAPPPLRRGRPLRLVRGFGPRGGASLELLVGRFAVDRLLVRARDQRAVDQRLALLGRDRPDLAAGAEPERALGDARAPLLVEQRDERLAHGELADRGHDVELRVG